jgi:hypothetical protein
MRSGCRWVAVLRMGVTVWSSSAGWGAYPNGLGEAQIPLHGCMLRWMLSTSVAVAQLG